ncbi:DNA-binding transcriptional regulator, IclR family [Brevibacterium sandarakinum]|uniref:DNA-binding transcriptional regulator, IclR family n=1 Tax=Brevibacterium sandarakinum TaxID=629680 RepID=A0A1H1QY85_BRESA|nr:IclR family transcriptional regulator [Brevibacterium sandarakinum]SDS28514.1 DNA-binding transcriptional regulator, IclR family [Brevibacterium sandarakinum]
MSNSAVIHRTFSVLEAVSASGSASAKTVADRLEIPLPTVYRLLHELEDCNYLAYLKEDKCFELGPKCFELGLSFQQRLVAPHPIRQITDELHRSLGTAAYFAIYRGSDILLTYSSDCEKHPRLRPLRFGFHEAAHATAFGKILLSAMPEAQRTEYLDARGMQVLTPHTIVRRDLLDIHLEEVATRGIAWEHDEFLPRQTCAAVPVRNGTGMQVGAIAVSTPSSKANGRMKVLESTLRQHAGLCSRYLRSGTRREAS